MKFTGERFLPQNIADTDEIYIEHMNRYIFASQFVEGKIVLDAACGEGYGTDILAEKAEKAYGIDLNEEVIDSASKKYCNANFSRMSIDDMSDFADDYFDVVVSFETIEHVAADTQKKFLTEIKESLERRRHSYHLHSK